jgi:DNA-binding NarL/FixJ family response regulator
MPARILIVDDHEIVRKGVRMLFANNDSREVCGEAQKWFGGNSNGSGPIP